jgi:hypothetical protein
MSIFMPAWGEHVTATVMIIKDVTALLGGYSPDFTDHDADTYETILSAAASPGDFVVFISGTNTLLDGFSVTGSDGSRSQYGAGIRVQGGAPVISHNRIYENSAFRGAGIFVSDATPNILDNRIYSNTAQEAAGGIQVIASGGSIQSNHIYSNTAQSWAGGGMEIAVNAWTSVISNTIVGNTANTGGGIAVNWYCTVTITGNMVLSNTVTAGEGGGIFVGDRSNAAIENNVVAYNRSFFAGSGINVRDGGTATIIRHNDVFSNETRQQGAISVIDSPMAFVTIDGNDVRNNRITGEDYWAGGINIENVGQPVTVTNNVIVGNQYGGVRISNGLVSVLNNTIAQNGRCGLDAFTWPPASALPFTVTVTNNIIVGHTECGVLAWNMMNPIIDYNDVWGNANNYCDRANPPSGSHNISADPQFANPGSGDYHICFGSPAMNAGTNADAPAYDKDGVPRPQMSRADMGAYELRGYQVFLPLMLKNWQN